MTPGYVCICALCLSETKLSIRHHWLLPAGPSLPAHSCVFSTRACREWLIRQPGRTKPTQWGWHNGIPVSHWSKDGFDFFIPPPLAPIVQHGSISASCPCASTESCTISPKGHGFEQNLDRNKQRPSRVGHSVLSRGPLRFLCCSMHFLLFFINFNENGN